MDLWLKNLRMCSFRKYRDLVPFWQLIYSSYWLRRATDHFLSIILAEVSKENFHLQEYVFPLLPSPYPVPNIACNFYDNRYTWSNPVIGKKEVFLHRSIIVILLSKFIDSKFSVTRISFPSCNQNPQPHNTHPPTPPPPCSFKVHDENLCTVSNPVISKDEYFKTDQSSPFFSADKLRF